MRKVFDVHAHYPAGSVMGMNFRLGEEDTTSDVQRKTAVDALVRQCEASGIVKICVLGGWGKMNGWVLDAYKEHINLIVPMAFLDLDTSTPTTVRMLKDQGFAGVKCILPRKNYDDALYMPLYEMLCQQKMPVLFHTGVFGGSEDYLEKDPKKPSSTELALDERLAKLGSSSARMRAIYLDTIATAFPELRIIGAHLGYGEYDLACAVARWRRNVYFDVSGGDVVQRHIKERNLIPLDISPNKLVFGSDCLVPMIKGQVEVWVDQLQTAGLSESEIDAVMYDNAAYIFGFDSARNKTSGN